MQQVVSEPDPHKIEKEGRVNWLEWKYTLCLCTSDWLLISILMCIYWKCLYNRTRQSSRFVSLESCKHQARKKYACLVQHKTLQALQDSAINITFRSVHFHTTPLTRPNFLIFRGSGSETMQQVWWTRDRETAWLWKWVMRLIAREWHNECQVITSKLVLYWQLCSSSWAYIHDTLTWDGIFLVSATLLHVICKMNTD